MENITKHLTQAQIKSITETWETSVTVAGYIVKQPSIGGSESVTLKELFDMCDDLSQSPIQPTKVKSILFKSDTGLVKNEFFLFNPIVVARTEQSKDYYVVSGRHRLAALATVVDLFQLNPAEYSLDVVKCIYPNIELLSMSIAAYNTNRTMTGAERERVVLTSKLEGNTPSEFNAEGTVGTVSNAKRHFRQVCLNAVLEVAAENDYDVSQLLTENTIAQVFGYVFDFMVQDSPELLKQLKSGSSVSWMFVPHVGIHAIENDYLTKPDEGNTARSTFMKKDLADSIVKSYYESIHKGGANETTDDKGDAF